MTLQEVQTLLQAKVASCEDLLDEEVQNAFGSDMMSEVLAYVQDQGILMTGLVNEQIIRTAAMKDMFCVVMVRGKQPTAEMISIAEENEIVLMLTVGGRERIHGTEKGAPLSWLSERCGSQDLHRNV